MADRIFAALWLVVTAAFAWAARDYQAQFAYEPIGPRAFPWLLAAISAACALWLLLRPQQVAETLPGLPPGGLPRAGVFALALVAYALLFEPIGFPLSTVIATVAIGRLFGGSWWKLVVAGVVLGLGLYILFDRVLDVTVPLGELWRT
jgi:putative tricarboxylic transport membrane protein